MSSARVVATTAAALVLATLLTGAPAAAQVIYPPQRPIEPVPAPQAVQAAPRVQQTTTLLGSVLGGYGNGLQRFGVNSSATLEPTFTGYADSGLRYHRFRGERSLDLSGRAYGVSFPEASITALWGADLRAQATTDLGRRNTLDVSAHGLSNPYVTVGAFVPLQQDVPLADQPLASSTRALSSTRSWSADAGVGLSHRWTRRNTLTMRYSYTQRGYESGAGYDNRTHRGQLGYDRTLGRSAGLFFTYQYSNTETQLASSQAVPLEQQSGGVGFRYSRRLSRSTRLAFSFSGGATYATTVNSITEDRLQDWFPSGHGGLSLFWGETWAVRADYRHAVTVLSGVSPDAREIDGVYLSGGGFIGSRLDITVAGALAASRTRSHLTGPGQFVERNASVQLRYALATWCGAVANYTYYRHRFTDVVDLPTRFPARLERNLVQVGLTFLVPLSQPRVPRGGARGGMD